MDPKDRPFVCDICGKGFGALKFLEQHYNGHTGAKLYKCRICSYTSKYDGNVLLHEKKVHKYFRGKDKNVERLQGEAKSAI